jgi:hypothetical protein
MLSDLDHDSGAGQDAEHGKEKDGGLTTADSIQRGNWWTAQLEEG